MIIVAAPEDLAPDSIRTLLVWPAEPERSARSSPGDGALGLSPVGTSSAFAEGRTVGCRTYRDDMLRALDPGESPPPAAYPLPWHVDRADRTHPRVANASAGVLDFVRVFVEHPGSRPLAAGERPPAVTEHWGRMLPREAAELCLCDHDLDDVVVTLAWFRPETGVEYVWRFVV